MSDLLDFVTTAHGGIQRWVAAKSVWADVDIYGPTFEAKGQDKLLGPCNVSAWTNRQHVTLRSEQSGHTVVFDGALDRVVVTSSRGQTIEVLDRPRGSMLDIKPTDAWTAAQAGYFVGYGMWSYLLEPYLLHWPGVQSREIDPWHERGETWRRLEVTFPNSLATHQTTYVYCFIPEPDCSNAWTTRRKSLADGLPRTTPSSTASGTVCRCPRRGASW